jgi:protein-tyrosine phosphatase
MTPTPAAASGSTPHAADGAVARWAGHLAANHGTWRGWVRATLCELEYGLGRLDAHLAPDLAQVRRVVFVCLGNINRSAFAEQVAVAHGLNCCSIGLSTSTGAPATDAARRMAPLFGCSLEQHRSTPLQGWQHEPGDLLLVMEARHARRLVAQGFDPGAIAMLGHWAAPRRLHLHDPHKLSDAYYRSCFTLIRSAVEGLALALKRHDSAAVMR